VGEKKLQEGNSSLEKEGVLTLSVGRRPYSGEARNPETQRSKSGWGINHYLAPEEKKGGGSFQ